MKTEELTDRREKETTTWKLSTHNLKRIERTERHVLLLQAQIFILIVLLALSLGGVI